MKASYVFVGGGWKDKERGRGEQRRSGRYREGRSGQKGGVLISKKKTVFWFKTKEGVGGVGGVGGEGEKREWGSHMGWGGRGKKKKNFGKINPSLTGAPWVVIL